MVEIVVNDDFLFLCQNVEILSLSSHKKEDTSWNGKLKKPQS